MADINKIVPFILKWEGGFINDKDDLGGATNKGITFDTYKLYCKSKKLKAPTIQDLKLISNKEWIDILKTLYWDKWRADEITNQEIANMLVDWLWNSGSYGIKIPQEILKVTVDGVVGEKTITALNKENPKILFKKIKDSRLKFIDDICKSRPANLKFKKGWLNRINNLPEPK